MTPSPIWVESHYIVNNILTVKGPEGLVLTLPLDRLSATVFVPRGRGDGPDNLYLHVLNGSIFNLRSRGEYVLTNVHNDIVVSPHCGRG